MNILPLRFTPGQDLRAALEAALAQHGAEAGYVLQGIGSLSAACLRFAAQKEAVMLQADLEILTLAGSVSPQGAHLHMSLADPQGQVFGGHVAPGCMVRTTAEVLLALLPEYRFGREPDMQTGFAELMIHPLKRG